jgi:cysteinyl-tRNA synthetase
MAPWQERFRAAIGDDLNTPRALAVVFDVLKTDELEPADRRELLADFDPWLGLGLADARVAEVAQESDPRVDALLAERQAAREARDFATADRIRDDLAAEGIEIVDTPEGPRWQRK